MFIIYIIAVHIWLWDCFSFACLLNYVREERRERWVEVTMHDWVQRGFMDGRLIEGANTRVVIHRSPPLDGDGSFNINICLLLTLQQFCRTLNEMFPECPELEVEMHEGIQATQPLRYYDV